LQRLGIAPDQCVFVDDVEQNVDGTRAVGIDAFRFESAAELARDLRDRGLA
jgi:FMN phosphatase YigB (HAD superfamily)